jgi:hypothetical protein
MTVTDEELAAYADGELPEKDIARVEAAIEADPALARTVERHRALRETLSGHFAPILDQPVPERLREPLEREPEVFDFTAETEKRRRKRAIPRWGWIAGPALAASLALAVFLPRDADLSAGYAGPQLAAALDEQLAGTPQEGDAPRILLSFRNNEQDYCRVFTSPDRSGIACRDETGWAFAEQAPGIDTATTQFRQAGNAQAQLLAQAQEMAEGSALTSAQEREAMASGWQ